jgi:hypothetical protein
MHTRANGDQYKYLNYLCQTRSPLFTADLGYVTENHGVGGSIPPLGTILVRFIQ